MDPIRPKDSAKLLFEHLHAQELGFRVVTQNGRRIQVLVPNDLDVGAIALEGDLGRSAIIHQSTKPGYRLWQVTYFLDSQVMQDESWDDLQLALDSARAKGLVVDRLMTRHP